MAGRVLTEAEIDDVRRALAGKSGGRSMSRPDTVMHDLLATLDAARNRVRQLEVGRGAGYCGYQWGMGARNHGGGCEEKFNDAEDVFRCLDCGGTFHKACLRKHFAAHSGSTKEAERAAIVAWLRLAPGQSFATTQVWATVATHLENGEHVRSRETGAAG